MAEFSLTPAPRLGGYDADFNGTHLKERDDLALVSLAIPLSGADAAAAAIRSAWAMEIPGPRHSTLSGDGAIRLLQTAQDQMMAVLINATPGAAQGVEAALGNAVYTTEQTDVWVALSLWGPHARRAMERICPIDLGTDTFPEGAFARTVMEHMGAIVLRDGPQSFLLFSASSSAESFLHAVETSIHNVA